LAWLGNFGLAGKFWLGWEIASIKFIFRIAGFTNKFRWLKFSLLFEKLDASMLTN
jgi:hypothetical protein